MQIERAWAMPNRHTFKIKSIHELLKRYIPSVKGKVIVDPFSDGEREFATVTNDLNPKVDAILAETAE